MESLNLLKLFRKAPRDDNVEVISDIDYFNSDYHKSAEDFSDEDDDDDDDDDSFFELELNTTKNPCFVESPRDVFRNGRVFQFDSTLSSKPQSPLKSEPGPKFKVLFFGFKKSKTETNKDSPRKGIENGQSKCLAFKCNVEELGILSRDNSLKSKLLREKRAEKEVPKYMKVHKPLYSMASMRYNADVIDIPESSPGKISVESRNSSFKKMYTSIGRSNKAVVGGIMPSPVNRRDDCLLNDGIQGAILHCKRSYNSAKELSRCVSDTSHEKPSVFRVRG